eukprot:COSAG03_NODE_2155_length_3069_cov_7.379461_2_plen_232_part_00
MKSQCPVDYADFNREPSASPSVRVRAAQSARSLQAACARCPHRSLAARAAELPVYSGRGLRDKCWHTSRQRKRDTERQRDREADGARETASQRDRQTDRETASAPRPPVSSGRWRRRQPPSTSGCRRSCSGTTAPPRPPPLRLVTACTSSRRSLAEMSWSRGARLAAMAMKRQRNGRGCRSFSPTRAARENRSSRRPLRSVGACTTLPSGWRSTSVTSSRSALRPATGSIT